jgi:hypothetical protein
MRKINVTFVMGGGKKTVESLPTVKQQAKHKTLVSNNVVWPRFVRLPGRCAKVLTLENYMSASDEIDFLEEVKHHLDLCYNLSPAIYASHAKVLIDNRIIALKRAEALKLLHNTRSTKFSGQCSHGVPIGQSCTKCGR